MISTKEKINSISKGNIILTSINLSVCSNFLIPNNNFNHYCFEIELSENSPVAICPYSILYNKNKESLTVTQTKDQMEIIISKNLYDFELGETSTKTLANGEVVEVIKLKAQLKEYRKDI